MVAPGSVVKTDDWSGYSQLPETGFPREILSSKELKLPHMVAPLLKRWLLGTYQGAVRPSQLAYYLDAFQLIVALRIFVESFFIVWFSRRSR